MSKKTKKTSSKVASKAGEILVNPKASKIQKKLAASALSQTKSSNQTSGEMEKIASLVLTSYKYNSSTKELAASVLSQSNKERT